MEYGFKITSKNQKDINGDEIIFISTLFLSREKTKSIGDFVIKKRNESLPTDHKLTYFEVEDNDGWIGSDYKINGTTGTAKEADFSRVVADKKELLEAADKEGYFDLKGDTFRRIFKEGKFEGGVNIQGDPSLPWIMEGYGEDDKVIFRSFLHSKESAERVGKTGVDMIKRILGIDVKYTVRENIPQDVDWVDKMIMDMPEEADSL